MANNKCQGCPNYKKNEYTGWMQCYGDKCETEVRADERRKFVEWCKKKGYGCYDWRMLIEQYEKEQKGETE